MARAFQLLARSEQFDWFFLSRYSADQFALGFSVQCHFTMCKLFLAAADGEQINSRGVQKSAWRSINTCLRSDHCICFQKEGIWFGGLIKVSFSQKRQHPNPKVWNMDCGAAAAAAYHDVFYPILLALEGTSPSIWHSACRRSWFCLARKRYTRWSPCSKSRRLSLSSSQKVNGDCCRRSKRNNLTN